MAYANKPDATRPRVVPLGAAGQELADRAVSLAGNGQWAEAAALNLELLKRSPRDISTLNRLGKCLTETGRHKGAIGAYEHALKFDPQNDIARKNLQRLSVLVAAETEVDVAASHASAAPRDFIADPATSTTTTLLGTADADALATNAPGAELTLRAERGALLVHDRLDRQLGSLEPRLTKRLLALMNGGNLYSVALASISDGTVRVIVHESFRHPSQASKTSFPARESAPTERAYTKDRLLANGDDEDEDEDEGGEAAGTTDRSQGDYPETDIGEDDAPDPFASNAPVVTNRDNED